MKTRIYAAPAVKGLNGYYSGCEHTLRTYDVHVCGVQIYVNVTNSHRDVQVVIYQLFTLTITPCCIALKKQKAVSDHLKSKQILHFLIW